MKLDKFYSLRKDFVIIGLTGRAGSGCSKVAELISKKDFIAQSQYVKRESLIDSEEIKFNMCYKYLNTPGNFEEYKIINYKNVLLLHLIFEAKSATAPSEYLISTLSQYGDNYEDYTNRFGIESDSGCINSVKVFLQKNLNSQIDQFKKDHTNLATWLKDADKAFIEHFFNGFQLFADEFYHLLNTHNITKRTRFIHDIAINLRQTGVCFQKNRKENDHLTHIYTVAESINRIIKLWRKSNNYKAKIVIDSLKNSLELMYFKEKYSSFYMLAINKDDEERKKYVRSQITKKYGDKETHIKEVIALDDSEYKGDDVNKGEFAAPDIENCIQKSDYHIFHSDQDNISGEDKLTNINYQLIKLLALISQPGIITPTAVERTMQVAFNAKYNSGCISRQVGAVITDEFFSVKSIGWNDVAQNQMPCKLRNVEDLISGKSKELFSEYELNGGEFKIDGNFKKFSELVKEDVGKVDLSDLNGRTCSFCFKSFQNTYEKEKNQVHTRSLHAEENAMMQITKNGGVGLKGGYLFTTASPCELCSKKAFQLGVTKIFFIDPYPGIARAHTLKNGVNGKGNPELEMFRGAVGRTFHKLYEPFMSHKDELKILTDFQPTERKIPIKESVEKLDISQEKKEKILNIINDK